MQAQNATPDLSQNPFESLFKASKQEANAAKEEVRSLLHDACSAV